MVVNAQKIKELREKENLSTYALAEKVYTSQSMITHIENKIKEPSVGLLLRIADYFKVSTDYLLDRDNPEAKIS